MTINAMLNSRHMPGADVVFDVADALGVKADDLRGPKKLPKKSA
jgi:hypothetical protein